MGLNKINIENIFKEIKTITMILWKPLLSKNVENHKLYFCEKFGKGNKLLYLDPYKNTKHQLLSRKSIIFYKQN